MASRGAEKESPVAQAWMKSRGNGYVPSSSASGLGSNGMAPRSTAPTNVVVNSVAARSSRCKDQASTVRLVGPVVAAGPVPERGGQRRRGAGMRRMYKRVNHFPVGQRGGAPGEEEAAQIHG